jgi:adenosylcobinamide kinase/adenosylcobinamide-phosphate guanylyltransferase
MRVVMLGTGAAAGWPNPWCRCRSCEWMRTHNDVRGQTSALVDGTLVIDCGPEAPRAAERLGHSLAGVRHLLFTHAHPDHTGPAALMWRGWVDRDDPLDVAGPPAVIDECRRWVGPDARLRWHSLRAGDVVTLGDYTVRAVAAAHGDASIGPALLYDVSGADATRILWATDTMALPDETVAAVDGVRFDAVFLEQTNGDDLDAQTDHLDLVSWPRQIAALRARGAVGDATTLVAVHLGHGNPPPPQLRTRMAAWGAVVPDDGHEFRLGGGAHDQIPTSRPRRVLVLGGARSGKSRWAESLLADRDDVAYVATSLRDSDDDEWEQRVAAHRARRPDVWSTVETLDVAKTIETHPTVLVECATLWVGALLEHPDITERMNELVQAVDRAAGTVVVVSNEVGDGVVPATSSGRRFRDLLGELNARLAQVCDEVWLVTAGLPRRLA